MSLEVQLISGLIHVFTHQGGYIMCTGDQVDALVHATLKFNAQTDKKAQILSVFTVGGGVVCHRDVILSRSKTDIIPADNWGGNIL